MKKKIILLLALLFAIDGFCQNLNFLGIPIQGTKTKFVEQLKNKGFSQYSDTTYIGKFYSYDSCVVKPVVIDGEEVSGMVLFLPSANDWATLNTAYNDLKKKLKKEFGDVYMAEKNEFNTPKEPYTDKEKYEALNDGKCLYMTTFVTNDANGEVVLLIQHLESGQNAVQVCYIGIDLGLAIVTNLLHMKFKGIPFDISADEFVSRMKKQGYKYVEKLDSHSIVMTGDFAGYSGCNIYITVLPDDVIGTVSVSFPYRDKWSYLQTTYNNIKSMLIKKYGKPYSCTEEFDYYRQPTSEYDAMFLLKQDKYKYETKFFVEGGIINLQISHIYVEYKDYFYVSLMYYDMGNNDKSTKNAIDDL